MKFKITSQQKQSLKAKAHSLKPVILLGQAGLTENVLTEIDRALEAHELLKIKIPAKEKEERQEIADQICQQLNAVYIQMVGKIVTVYRKNPDKK